MDMSLDHRPSEFYREEVLRARAEPEEQKLLAGLRLFDQACRIMADGIRHEYPGAEPETVRQILAQRLAVIRRLESTE